MLFASYPLTISSDLSTFFKCKQLFYGHCFSLLYDYLFLVSSVSDEPTWAKTTKIRSCFSKAASWT